MSYLLKSKTAIILLFWIIAFACKPPPSKFDADYPEYTTEKNTTESYEMVNDSTLFLSITAENKAYGRSPKSPIFVGVTNAYEGGKNRERFLNALEMEDGKEIKYERLKSCCPFKTLNSRTIGADQKFGLLDVWVLYPKGENNSEADTLYINAYDEGNPMIPKGYRAKK
ncbi:hypothetical protein QYS48_30360 [Marivirga arenosa]|uniref:2-dehydro-3-deoxyphosphooctonate aldolase n=1 Tax=Marivirga arenosa TaxID=3059076 RepID=A0AA51N8F2_9BACT|nr:hypothetical protein [Marivirga sp. ABR2-2]WMN07918.1 hypothetical protein QYS48_30360 [Marivirga sp. ABR2-2]